MSQTNRVVRHKTNARKNWTKPVRSIIVYQADGHIFTTSYKATSLREALVMHRRVLGIEDATIIGNVMTHEDVTYVAIDV